MFERYRKARQGCRKARDLCLNGTGGGGGAKEGAGKRENGIGKRGRVPES